MLVFHLAYALYLLSLSGGLALFIWALRAEGPGRIIGRIFGVLIIVLSMAGAFCLGYHAIKYWPNEMDSMSYYDGQNEGDNNGTD
jgi:hypothetical protein